MLYNVLGSNVAEQDSVHNAVRRRHSHIAVVNSWLLKLCIQNGIDYIDLASEISYDSGAAKQKFRVSAGGGCLHVLWEEFLPFLVPKLAYLGIQEVYQEDLNATMRRYIKR